MQEHAYMIFLIPEYSVLRCFYVITKIILYDVLSFLLAKFYTFHINFLTTEFLLILQ